MILVPGSDRVLNFRISVRVVCRIIFHVRVYNLFRDEYKYYFLEFFLRLDEECGVLNLHSTLYHLVMYTRKGLEYISQVVLLLFLLSYLLYAMFR